jgi:hypothetical protein
MYCGILNGRVGYKEAGTICKRLTLWPIRRDCQVNMNTRQQRQYDRFKSSIQFLDKHNGEFVPSSRALAFGAELKKVVAALDQGKATPTPAKVTAASSKRAALNALRSEMSAIVLTASAIAATDPKFKNHFAMPDGRKTEDLTAAARAFIQKGEAVKSKFAEFEMSPDFLERLQKSLDAYEMTLAPKATGQEKKGRGGAVSPGGDLIETGARLIDVLDVAMNNKYRDESEPLEEWRLALSLEKRARKKAQKRGKN